jgi:hypothetical protein
MQPVPQVLEERDAPIDLFALGRERVMQARPGGRATPLIDAIQKLSNLSQGQVE